MFFFFCKVGHFNMGVSRDLFYFGAGTQWSSKGTATKCTSMLASCSELPLGIAYSTILSQTQRVTQPHSLSLSQSFPQYLSLCLCRSVLLFLLVSCQSRSLSHSQSQFLTLTQSSSWSQNLLPCPNSLTATLLNIFASLCCSTPSHQLHPPGCFWNPCFCYCCSFSIF